MSRFLNEAGYVGISGSAQPLLTKNYSKYLLTNLGDKLFVLQVVVLVHASKCACGCNAGAQRHEAGVGEMEHAAQTT